LVKTERSLSILFPITTCAITSRDSCWSYKN